MIDSSDNERKHFPIESGKKWRTKIKMIYHAGKKKTALVV